jgi:diaminopimelate decarboxylase
MNHFDYKNGELYAEDVTLPAIAAAVGTPFYCYSSATLERHYRVFSAAMGKDSLVAFSVKANGNLAVLKTLASLGAGADVVSGGEMKRALAAGIPGEKIVFSGVGKTRAEMALGLKNGLYQFNVESEVELLALDEVAGGLGVKAPVAFRVNPDVDAKTHAKISTGHAETKFGIPWSQVIPAYRLAASLKNIDIVGVDVHIGSQITELAPFEAAFSRVVELVGTLRGEGHAISRIDLGGGLGVPYRNDNLPPPDPAAYGALAARITKDSGARLIMEPGRLIAANAGILVAGVIYVKKGVNKEFLILDAAMNDLIRPAFYDAYHEIVPVKEPNRATEWTRYDVVGPVCETSDIFAADRALPKMGPNDLIAILTAGAYGAVMSSAYNARPPAAEVLVKGGEWAVVRPRMDDDALFGNDRIPAWLG